MIVGYSRNIEGFHFAKESIYICMYLHSFCIIIYIREIYNMCIYIYIRVYMYMCIYVHVCIYIYICVCVCGNLHYLAEP